jgi:tetratricopeptide (TPR) repeat protein
MAECTAGGFAAGAGAARLQLGAVLRFTGRREEAITELEQARTELVAGGETRSAGYVEFEIAMALTSLGDAAAARRRFTAAEELLRRAGDLRGCANALAGLSRALIDDGQVDAAVVSARQAVEIVERIGDRRLTAIILGLLGSAQLAADDVTAARQTLLSSFAAAQELAADDAATVSCCELAEAHRRLGDLSAAAAAFVTGAELADRTEMSLWRARADFGLARVAIAGGDVDRGRRLLLDAIPVLDRTDRRQAARARAELAELSS